MLEVICDLVGFTIMRKVDYHKHMCITLGLPNWTAPIVYLIGSGVFTDKKPDVPQTKTPRSKKVRKISPENLAMDTSSSEF